MRRLVPVLVLAAAALGAAFFLFGGGEDESLSLPVDEDVAGPDARPPALMATEAVRRRQEADAEAARRKRAAERNVPPPDTTEPFLRGRIVDDATGRPLAAAVVWAEPARPLSLLPQRESWRIWTEDGWSQRWVQPSVTLRPSSVVTNAKGRFVWRVERGTAPGDDARAVLFASAAGHVTGRMELSAGESDVTLRLQKAIPLHVLVTDGQGRPVAGATVRAKPSGDTPRAPGHAGVAGTDETGRCVIDGLLAGEIVVTADHPSFMPAMEWPIDPATQKEVTLRLPPAMRFTFTLRSDDGSEIRNPTLRWVTDGKLPHEDLLLLHVTNGGPPSAPATEVKSAVVRIPCDHANVQLEIKADGFEAVRPAPEPLPTEGGEKALILILVRDTSLAPLRIRYEGADGKPVAYSDLGAAPPSLLSLDDQEIGSVTFVGGETLFFQSLPAGRYRIGKRSPKYAPAEVDVDVRAGETNEVTVKLKPTAKLRVLFRAAERLVVRFRLRRDGQILPAFPASASTPGADATGTDASGLSPLQAGADGETFTGLGAGSVTVDVTDPTLVAAAKTVTLREGETTEVEIDVRKR